MGAADADEALLALIEAVRSGERHAIREAATSARAAGVAGPVVDGVVELGRPRTLRMRAAQELDRRLARDLELPLVVEIAGRAAPLSHAAQAALGIGFEGGLDEAIARLTGVPPNAPELRGLLADVSTTGSASATLEGARRWCATAWRDDDQRLRVVLRPTTGASPEDTSLHATLVHELSNGLTAISTLASLGARSAPEERDAVFRRIERAASDTLDAVRATRQRGSVPPLGNQPRADVSGVLADLLERFELLGREREIRLVTRLGSDLAVVARPAEVRSIVWNLVKNAFEAVPRGGTVRVGASYHEERVRIVVADDGPGMDEAQKARIFEPYFTTKPEGSGLGLPLVRHLVERLEGELTLETSVGRGARFVVSLPASSAVPVTSHSGMRPRRPLDGATVAVGAATEVWRDELEALGARVVGIDEGEPDVAWLDQADRAAVERAHATGLTVRWAGSDTEDLLVWWVTRTSVRHIG
ncbi:MAG: HAMP domain-containing histidine kinase [Sandaracinus sp.]|nr:HAMP domain-containing histidine kinase [Sandaracinus sp.]